ncbi:TPA: hypothetical protein N0F65_003446 [Lagenidium giganteum]|uniref:Uncharacterized protein n=1 Tax=Lagenidium giganteum TaxID=4803 RepID=A0AAV2YGY4_9STRA|nr:TPA: hypothetical protein N0F65_003446 [Lagenidium giganteum]
MLSCIHVSTFAPNDDLVMTNARTGRSLFLIMPRYTCTLS